MATELEELYAVKNSYEQLLARPGANGSWRDTIERLLAQTNLKIAECELQNLENKGAD